MARLLSSVKGHEDRIRRLLQNASENHLAPTLLFLGPSGIGKKKVALGLAQALFCEVSREAYGSCPSCLRLEKGQHENLLVIEPDGVQIKIEQVRAIQDFTRLKLLGKARVTIIDEAQAMTVQAANTLLKILEEPPPHTYFILISSQEGGVLPTLRSRSRIVRFAPLSFQETNTDPDLASEKVRQVSYDVLKKILQGDRFEALASLPLLTKEKESSLSTIQCWQRLVRDAWFTKLEIGPLLNPAQESLARDLGRMDFSTLDRLAQESFQLEKDIHANVDRTLLFETFCRGIHGMD